MGDGFFDKMKHLIGLEEIEEEEVETIKEVKKFEKEPKVHTPVLQPKENRVVNFQQKTQMKLILNEPKSFDECPKIVDNLKNRKPIILNLEKLDSDVARKIFDFISGATYALDGNVQKVANNIFLFTPDNVDVSGNIEHRNLDEDLKNPWR